MGNISRNEIIISAIVIAIGLAAAGFFIGQTLYNAKVAINTADVKGLAERRVMADRAYWKIQYTVTGKDKSKISELYEQSEADQKQVSSVLLESGFEPSEISPGVINYLRQEFRDENQKLVEEKYLLVGSIEVETSKVKLLSEVRSKMNKLIARGLDIKK